MVAKAGFVTLALPAGFVLPAGVAQFDEVEAHVAVGTDGKLTLLSLQSDDEDDRDEDGVDVDDEGEVEVTGTITALSDTSVSVTAGAASPVTCSLAKPLTGFAVGDRVEIECRAGATAGTLVLKEIEHEDDDDRDNDDDDDHSGPGHGGDDH